MKNSISRYFHCQEIIYHLSKGFIDNDIEYL